MLKISSFLALSSLVMGLLVIATDVNATQMFKCKVNGTVTFQQDPCPVGQIRKPPTLQELNAGEKKRREAAAAVAAEKPAIAQEKAAAYPQSSEKFTPSASNLPTTSASTANFSCDGRKHCSQMKSCAEAKYFLANCPGVKMDGDNDGIPCEEQWCSR